jgi:hypothetical protein
VTYGEIAIVIAQIHTVATERAKEEHEPQHLQLEECPAHSSNAVRVRFLDYHLREALNFAQRLAQDEPR